MSPCVLKSYSSVIKKDFQAITAGERKKIQAISCQKVSVQKNCRFITCMYPKASIELVHLPIIAVVLSAAINSNFGSEARVGLIVSLL